MWQKKVGADIVASPAINQNFVYCASNIGVYCLTRETGQVKWHIKTSRIVETSLALTHKAIFFGDFLGNFYIAETSQGNIIETLSTNASMTSSPFVKENTVFFANYSGDLYAVKFSE